MCMQCTHARTSAWNQDVSEVVHPSSKWITGLNPLLPGFTMPPAPPPMSASSMSQGLRGRSGIPRGSGKLDVDLS